MRAVIISCFAIESPPRGYGGAEAQAYYLAHGLARRGHEVLLVGAKGSRCEGAQVLEVVEPAYRGLAIEEEAYRKYRDEVLAFKPDVIYDHTHFFSAYRLKLRHPKLRVIKTFHDLMPAHTPPPKGSYDCMVAVSKFHAKYLEDKWGLSHGTVKPIYNGIDVERFPFQEKKENWFLFFSRMAEGKGAYQAVRLARKHGFKLVVAGEDSVEKGNDPAYVWKVIRECDGEKIRYLGRVSEEAKLELLSRAKALILPYPDPKSYQEVFGCVVLEASASGTPVLTVRNGAMEELISHGETGFIADHWEELAKYFERVDAIKPEACREWVKNNFDIDRMITNYRSISWWMLCQSRDFFQVNADL